MTETDLPLIRDALTDVSHAVDVPAPDRLELQRRVRGERRRRTGGRVLLAGAAAVVVAAGALAVPRLAGLDLGPDVSAGSRPAPERGSVSETVWFVRDGRLTALDPSGEVHTLGVRSEGVVGYTSERVYAIDAESGLVVRGRESDQEGQGRDSAYPPEESPVPGPAQSVALSGDGRYLAWLDLGHTVTVYDVKAEQVSFRADVPRNSYVAAVGADGVLVAEDADLVLHTATGETVVPGQIGSDSWASQVAGGRVLATGIGSSSTVYDVGAGGARRIAVVAGGSAALSPDGAAVATIETAPDDSAVVNLWDGGDTQRLHGLDGIPEQVRFADETTLLVQTRGGSADLWACSTTDRTCGALPVPAGTIRLSE